MTDVVVLAATAAQAAAGSGDDSGGSGFVLLLLLLAGPLFALWVHLRYRNTDKRHHHESETRSTMVDLVSDDTFVTSRKGLTGARMAGANNRKHRGG